MGDLHHHPDDVGDLGGEFGEHGRRLLVTLLRVVGCEELLAEPEGPAPEGVHGVVAEVVGEPALDEDAQQRVHVAQQGRCHGGPRLDHRGRPRVAEHHPAGGEDPVPEDALPLTLALGDVESTELLLDLADDRLDDTVEQGLLVGDVVVQRHRLDAERLGEVAHGEGLDALRVGELDGGGEHPLPGEGEPRLGDRLGL